MANINWDSQELESTAAQVNTLLQNYDKTMDEIQQTLNTMEFRLKLRTDVDNDLSKLKRRVSQERSKMQQVRQTVNLAAGKTTDLNGKLIGYTNDIGDLSVKSNASNISAGNSVNFLQWTALGSLGISGMVDVISGFVSKIGSWLLGKKSGQTDTSTTPSIDYSGKEHPNTVSSSDVSNTTSNASSTTQKTYGLTESTGSSRGNAEAAGLRYYAQMDASTWSVNGSDGQAYLNKRGAVGCGASAMAMVASYYYPDRQDYNPGKIADSNSAHTVGISQENARSIGLRISNLGAGKGDQDTQLTAASQQVMISKLDKALSDYQSGNGAPPVVGIDNGKVGNNHYVVILGKNSDGSYIIADSNQKTGSFNGCTKLVTTLDAGKLSRKNGTYTSYIKQIYLFDKLA